MGIIVVLISKLFITSTLNLLVILIVSSQQGDSHINSADLCFNSGIPSAGNNVILKQKNQQISDTTSAQKMSPSTLIQPSTPRMILASNMMVIELSRVQFVYVIT